MCNNNGAMAGTIDWGRALATFIKPKSFAASSLLGKILVTNAMSTEVKHPKPRPIMIDAISTAVYVGTNVKIKSPIKIIAADPYKDGFCFLILSDKIPPKILDKAVAANPNKLRVAMLVVASFSVNPKRWIISSL